MRSMLPKVDESTPSFADMLDTLDSVDIWGTDLRHEPPIQT